MYRDSDLRVFVILSAAANIFGVAAFALIMVYHFYDPKILFRNWSIFLLTLSWFLKMQLFVQKLEIMEVRLENLIQGGIHRSKMNLSMESFLLILYFVLFWATLIGVLLGFIPLHVSP